MTLSSIACQFKKKKNKTTMANEVQQELEGGTSVREREEFWKVVRFACNWGEDAYINPRRGNLPCGRQSRINRVIELRTSWGTRRSLWPMHLFINNLSQSCYFWKQSGQEEKPKVTMGRISALPGRPPLPGSPMMFWGDSII